jgi:hypothetical protein
MAQRVPHADPYSVSGHSAAGQTRLRMKCEALQRSIEDADDLERRGHGLIRRSNRRRLYAGGTIASTLVAAALLSTVAANAHDGTYEGVLAGNWAMLGAVVSVGGLTFAWSWLSSLVRLRETGLRLLRRAEYQRRLATLQLTEIEHATVR